MLMNSIKNEVVQKIVGSREGLYFEWIVFIIIFFFTLVTVDIIIQRSENDSFRQ